MLSQSADEWWVTVAQVEIKKSHVIEWVSFMDGKAAS